jgi:predicted DNA-binding transcriptional regulator AlpA
MSDQKERSDEPRLIGDQEIAQLVSMSRSWVRKQRLNRRRALPHSLAVDPVMVGSVPRYRHTDIANWISSLSASSKVPTSDAIQAKAPAGAKVQRDGEPQ